MENYELKFDVVETLQTKANEISALINHAEKLDSEKGLMRNALFVHALGQAQEASRTIRQFLSDYSAEVHEDSLERYLDIADRGINSLRFYIEQILEGGIGVNSNLAMSLSI